MDIFYIQVKEEYRIGEKMVVYEMDFWQTWEIDTYDEIDLLSFYYKKFLIEEK